MLEVARANLIDGTPIVAASACSGCCASTGCSSASARRAEGDGLGFFRVERPNHLWRLDMTNLWVAEHGWRYLSAAIDCRTREICGWTLDLRRGAPEAIAVINAAALERGVVPGELPLGPTPARCSPRVRSPPA